MSEKSRRKKKRFKVRYVVLGILAVLVIVAAVAVGTHWDTIQAARMGMTMDRDELLANQEEKDREIEESLGINGLITDEMIAQAQAEIEASLSGEGGSPGGETPAAGETGQAAGGTGQTGGESAGQAAASATDIVAKYTTKLYGIRGVFEGRLSGLVAAARAEYEALPADQKTSSSRNSILTSKLASAEAMEAECDAMVESLLGEMEAELKAAGESTAPVGQLRSYYQEAKINQKAYYLSLARGS